MREIGEFVCIDPVFVRSHGIDEVDVPLPGMIRQVAKDGHQWGDSDSAGNKNDSFGLEILKEKLASGSPNSNRIADLHLIVHEARNASFWIALDRQFHVSPLHWRRSDRVRAFDRLPVDVEG